MRNTRPLGSILLVAFVLLVAVAFNLPVWTQNPELQQRLAEVVDGTDNTDHVCAAIVNGKLRIDATENQETVVPIAVLVETIRDGVNRLEEVRTGI